MHTFDALHPRHIQLSGDDRLYDKCFQSLLQSDCVAGVSWLNPRGCPLYERRLDQHLPAGKEGDGLGLVSAAEGRQLVSRCEGKTASIVWCVPVRGLL